MDREKLEEIKAGRLRHGAIQTVRELVTALEEAMTKRDALAMKLKEYEAFNAPLRRTYNKNTVEEAAP